VLRVNARRRVFAYRKKRGDSFYLPALRGIFQSQARRGFISVESDQLCYRSLIAASRFIKRAVEMMIVSRIAVRGCPTLYLRGWAGRNLFARPKMRRKIQRRVTRRSVNAVYARRAPAARRDAREEASFSLSLLREREDDSGTKAASRCATMIFRPSLVACKCRARKTRVIRAGELNARARLRDTPVVRASAIRYGQRQERSSNFHSHIIRDRAARKRNLSN